MIFIHIGLSKTGTTFLQEEVYPYWYGIHYLGKNIGKPITLKKILTLIDDKHYLISDEGISSLESKTDKEKEITLANLSQMFPNANVIISFRRHRSLITSLYKQNIHDGETTHFDDFFNAKYNNGKGLKKEDVNYKYYIRLIEQYFVNKPFVFLQEELNDNFAGVIKDLENYMGGKSPNINILKNKKSNKGINHYQSVLLLKINKLFKTPKNPHGFIPYNKYTILSRKFIQYVLRKPLSNISNKPIKMDEEQKRLADEYYRDDWEFVLNYIKNECPYRNNFDDSKYR